MHGWRAACHVGAMARAGRIVRDGHCSRITNIVGRRRGFISWRITKTIGCPDPCQAANYEPSPFQPLPAARPRLAPVGGEHGDGAWPACRSAAGGACLLALGGGFRLRAAACVAAPEGAV